MAAHGAEATPGGVPHPAGAGGCLKQRFDHLMDRGGVGEDVVSLDRQVATGQHHGHPVVTQGAGEHDPVPGLHQVGPQLASRRDHPNARVREWAEEMLVYLDGRIRERADWDREPAERFE